MASKIALGVPCDVCGQDEYWDNRVGKKNPKGPDYACANKECAGKDGFKFARWERDRSKWGAGIPKPASSAPVAPQEPAGAPKGGRLTSDDTTPDERGERVFTWAALAYTYGVLTKAVVKGMLGAGLGEVVPTGPDSSTVSLDQSAVQAGVATLLIQGEKAHIPLLSPRKVAKDEVARPAKVPEAVTESGGEFDWP
jgi:hypothetical protein